MLTELVILFIFPANSLTRHEALAYHKSYTTSTHTLKQKGKKLNTNFQKTSGPSQSKLRQTKFYRCFCWAWHFSGPAYPLVLLHYNCHNPNATSSQLKSWVLHENDFNPPPTTTTTETQCQQYLSCYWPNFNQTLNLGSWDEQQQQHLQQH